MALQYATEESSIFKIGKSGKAGRISKRRFRSGNSRLGGKTPTRIKPVDMINGAPFHPRRIVAFAQRRRNAGHNCGPDIADASLCGAMNVPAETGYNPKGAVQNLAQSQHHLWRLKIHRVRPHGHLKRRMVCKNRNRFGDLGVDQVDQTLRARHAKVTLVAVQT
jgi:hypothetical protein